MADFIEIFCSLVDAFEGCQDAYKALKAVCAAAGPNPLTDWTMEWAIENIKLQHDRYMSECHSLSTFIWANAYPDGEDDDYISPWEQDFLDLEFSNIEMNMVYTRIDQALSDYLCLRRCHRNFNIHSIVANPITAENVSSTGQGHVESDTHHGCAPQEN